MIGRHLSANRDCRLFVSNDVDDTRERIAKVMQPHDLRPIGRSGGIDARMSFLRLPGIGFGTIRFGRMALRLDPVEDYHLMIFCLSGSAEVRSRGETSIVEGPRGICLAPEERVEAEFSADCEQFVVRVDQATMRRESGLDHPRLARTIDASHSELRPWANIVRAMLDDNETIGLLQTDQRIAGQFEQLFTSTLLRGHRTDRRSPDVSPAPAAVRRAIAYIEANLCEPLALSDIAAAAEVPVRTLLSGFQRFRQVSPMQYARDRRLDRARALLVAGTDNTNVTSIALAVGFSHLGRFAQAYRLRFGEAPSDTRSRRGARSPAN